MGRLDDKVAVITGGSSGIGLACAARFVKEGARVFITGRNAAALENAVAQLGADATGVQGDVTVPSDLDRLFETVKDGAGRIDVLMANAGGGEFYPLAHLTEAHVDRVFGINVKATIFTVQKSLGLLTDGASIVLTGSSTALKGSAAFSVYAASKAAVRTLARNWMVELGSRRIRVNVLVPGATDTPALARIAPDETARNAILTGLAAKVPLGRIATADDIASAALFLASSDSGFVNGSELIVDGGFIQV